MDSEGETEAWMAVEAIAENDAGGAALKHGGRWYECSHILWQFAAWPEMEFTVHENGTVDGLRARREVTREEAVMSELERGSRERGVALKAGEDR